MIICTKSYARIGLIGNPSDAYFGKTISSTITNFSAEVKLWESPTLQVLPNAIHDPTQFSSLSELNKMTSRNGYYGGLRLILATCKKFKEYCQKNHLSIEDKNFTISYETDIPRQVGLGGSSAIITAVLKALMKFYSLTNEEIPKPIIPNLALSVETEELELNAGLQDRVVQVYGGTVFMDFAEVFMKTQGYGNYQQLDPNLLSPMFLAYLSEPSDSGKIHGDVKFRYQQGDSAVVQAMQTFGDYATQFRKTIEDQEDPLLCHELMNKNFDLRQKIFGEKVISGNNLKMIEVARKLGCSAKFPGSGGAVIGIYDTNDQFDRLKKNTII